jgi:hypothetical protein
MEAHITAFWDVTTCILVDTYQHYANMLPPSLGVCSIIHPEDGGRRFVQNVSTYVHGVTCCKTDLTTVSQVMSAVYNVHCCKTDLTTASQVLSAVYNVHCTLTACRERDCETDSCRAVGLTALCFCAVGEPQQEQQEEVAHSFD